MSTNPQHPFQPGTRVAIRTGYYGYGYGECTYNEAFVDRVYKNGRFLLRGSDQQWKARHSFHDDWRADRTGDRRWDRSSVILWDEKNGAEIEAARAREALWDRACKIQKRVERWKREDVTRAMLDAIEAALGEGVSS